MSAKRIAYYGSMLGLAIICGYVEMLIPFDFGIPGIKLGLANIVALAVSVSRVLLIGILFGNAMSVFYSLAGGVLSLIVMYLVKKIPYFSTVGVSVAGAAAHNIGQLAAALVVIGMKAVMFYLPFLLIAAVITGFLIGLGAGYLIKRINFKM